MRTSKNPLWRGHTDANEEDQLHSSVEKKNVILSLYIFAFCIFIYLPPVNATEKESYLSITASAIPSSKGQPKWIAIKRDNQRNLIHLPADQVLTKIKPGNYTVSHIDFGDKSCKPLIRRSCKTLWIPTKNADGNFASIHVLPGTITVYGSFSIKRQSSGKYDIELYPPAVSLPWICTYHREVFSNHSAHILQGDKSYKTVKIKCTDG
ncbi:hypothetical protein AUP74_01806 [Microbulbifer aggregans]|uniref:Uncharacterized protein n=1 Tax=Microbulbifer aggregans TaxID=1769779 RepID=A0A1C9W7U6_9GAMM|nr:hypothetical protein [Microbulbifer aggregans]AOS97237.1 hypothetical protein AUP74_01806 [Microbulbifer aggregans]